MKYQPNANEVQLVKNLSKGNLLAFNTLFREYCGRLYRFAYGYLKSEAESEELVQEVFTKIWEKRKKLKSELSFKSYLFTISFNIIRKHFRTRAYASGYFKAEIYNDVDLQTTQKITSDSLFQFIKELVDRLPNRRKEIFIKSRFEGQNIKDIAEDLNISHKTVENQLTEALKYIRYNLKREGIIYFLIYMIYTGL
jgi:RNA polymerase sigma-70 factor (ECF subfamily)